MSHVPPTGSGQANALTNASGAIIATAKPLGSAPPINLADRNRDHDTFCNMGGNWFSIATLVKMGVLTRKGTVLTENYSTRQGAGGTVKQVDKMVPIMTSSGPGYEIRQVYESTSPADQPKPYPL